MWKKVLDKSIYFFKIYINGKNRIIFFLFTIIFASLSIADVVLELFIYPVKIAVYTLAAASFFLSCAMWYTMIRMTIKVALLPFTETNALANRFRHDYAFSSIIMTLPGTLICLVFAIVNAVLGIYLSSAWSGSLAAYYMCLCFMRITVISYSKHLVFKEKYAVIGKIKELKVQRMCGIILIVLSIALLWAVIMLVGGRVGTAHSEVFTIAIAAYTFYKLAMSIKNMVKARRVNDSLIITLRNIGHADALVSILYLQTALFATFGGSQEFTMIMNSITGVCVIFASLAIGITMIVGANRKLKKQMIAEE